MIYTMKREKYILTKHAKERLAERTGMMEDEFLDLANSSAVLVYRSDEHSQYEIFWSRKTRMGYVLVVNPQDGAIVTVKRVLSKTNHPCVMLDSKKEANRHFDDSEYGVATVTAEMLKKAVLAAGADISEAREVLEILKGHEARRAAYKAMRRNPRTWNYRWVVRFLYAKDGVSVSKTNELGKLLTMDAPEEVEPTPEMAEAAFAAVAELSGWDAVLTLVSRDTGATVREWDLADLAEVA